MKARFPAALTVLALAALPLGACGGSGGDGGDDERTASGEVLQGTISDEMLPLDTVTSEPPLMKTESPKAGAGSGAQAEGGEAAEGEDGAAEAGEQPPAPAATATQSTAD